MKWIKLNHIRLIAILGVLSFLMGFANHRQNLKPIQSIEVKLLDASKIFITEAEVEKLILDELMASEDSLMTEIRLAKFETLLNTNEMIKSSQVFYTLDGRLSAELIQRKPIARIRDHEFYYLDADGQAMPLSPNYSSRVPLVSGVKPEDLKEIYPLLVKIEADDFLKKHIIAIRKQAQKSYSFEVRDREYTVNFGQMSYLDRKLSNYKVFYLKALEYNKLDNYKRIDLQFGNQVVCTIK